MLIRPLVLSSLLYLVNGGGYETYNGHGKGYGDYGPEASELKYTEPQYRYTPKSGRVLSSYGYPFGKIATRPSVSRSYSLRPSLKTSFKDSYSSMHHGSSKPEARSYHPVSNLKKQNFGYVKTKIPYSSYSNADFGKVNMLKSNPKRADYGKRTYYIYDKSDPLTGDYEKPYEKHSRNMDYFKESSEGSNLGRTKYIRKPSYEEPTRKYRIISSYGGPRISYHDDKMKYFSDGKKFYGQPGPAQPMFFSHPYRNRDPCVGLEEGEYVLDSRFKEIFAYADPQCYFVKCANKKAYLNPCSKATRNKKDGSGFCSIIDLEGYCGVRFHDAHKTP